MEEEEHVDVEEVQPMEEEEEEDVDGKEVQPMEEEEEEGGTLYDMRKVARGIPATCISCVD
ncbi:hypothetical protein DPMN_059610 [Dreissena polymorpha]|uniref:Uncharacterized protein n=1 Tax=Dreissena polymorpha TaxID=45954 RepID=A0A9D4C3T4_DREPO|nr:hypothetical protein DPMN_059610 [Dreissena polymorpha]